jgi:GYF domain 2
MQVYVNRNGQQFGPYEESVVLEKLRAGELSPADLGIRQGETAWRSLGEMFPATTGREPIQPLAQPGAEAKKGGCLKSGLIGAGILLFLLGVVIAAGSRFIPSPSCDMAKSDREQIEKLQREIEKMRSDFKSDGLGEKLIRLKSLESGYETSRKYCDNDKFRDNVIGGAGALAAFVGFLMAVIGLFVGRKK